MFSAYVIPICLKTFAHLHTPATPPLPLPPSPGLSSPYEIKVIGNLIWVAYHRFRLFRNIHTRSNPNTHRFYGFDPPADSDAVRLNLSFIPHNETISSCIFVESRSVYSK